LALALGRTVAELEATMTMDEYAEWVDYYADDPFGEMRADLRSGVLSVVIAKSMGSKKRLDPMDFMPIVAAQKAADEAAATMRERVQTMRNTFESNLGSIRLRRTRLNKE
jgi:hypothetical protein